MWCPHNALFVVAYLSSDRRALLILRVLLVREEIRELLDPLDSRVFPDPRVLLVRLASPESRY